MEDVAGATLRVGLVCPSLVSSSCRLADRTARLLRAVRRLAGREAARAEAGLLPGVAEGGRTLSRDEAREGVVDGGRDAILALR